MLMVIDIGNTRIKWSQVKEGGRLDTMQAVMHGDIASSPLKKSLMTADKVIIANVAENGIALQLTKMTPEHGEVIFAVVQAEACGVTNRYSQHNLGIDRWAAVIAAWHHYKQPTIVINAGTAITIDALSQEIGTKKATYLGGSIMPGLQLMYNSLAASTERLPLESTGKFSVFPDDTQDAIHSGCINAIVGAVVLQLKQLEKHCTFLPKVVISGGDAVKIAEALSKQMKRVAVVDDLVLQGLVLLEKEFV